MNPGPELLFEEPDLLAYRVAIADESGTLFQAGLRHGDEILRSERLTTAGVGLAQRPLKVGPYLAEEFHQWSIALTGWQDVEGYSLF